MIKEETRSLLEAVQEFNPYFHIGDIRGNLLGIARRCGDEAVIVKKAHNVPDMKNSGIKVAFMFPMGKKAADIYPHIVGMDDAIIGVTIRPWKGKFHHVLVYDDEKMLQCHMKTNKWTREQAEEWADFNDNAWHGPTNPLVMKRMSAILE